MARFLFDKWILNWLLKQLVFEFEWDKGNQFKNKDKHRVEDTEIEEVFKIKKFIPLGIQISPKVEEKRYGLIGITNKEKILQVVFTIRNNRIRPISARPAHKKERTQYEENVRSQT